MWEFQAQDYFANNAVLDLFSPPLNRSSHQLDVAARTLNRELSLFMSIQLE